MTGNAFASGPIFVPLDGSELAEQAVPYADALAAALKRAIVLMIATRTPEVWNNVPAAGDYDGKAHAHCVENLEKVRRRLQTSDVRIDVRDGFARDEILHAADDSHASLIIATSHGRSGITRWMYGSIASHLIHQSDVPLLIVGREALTRSSHLPIRKIMVPLDGSALAEVAIAHALELAKAFGARVLLVRVLPCAVQAYPFVTPAMYVPVLDSELESIANTYLTRVHSKLESSVLIDATLLRGPIAGSLTQFVEDQAVDLTVMTTHARAGLQRAVLGSTADRMLQGHALVLLIRPPEQPGSTEDGGTT